MSVFMRHGRKGRQHAQKRDGTNKVVVAAYTEHAARTRSHRRRSPSTVQPSTGSGHRGPAAGPSRVANYRARDARNVRTRPHKNMHGRGKSRPRSSRPRQRLKGLGIALVRSVWRITTRLRRNRVEAHGKCLPNTHRSQVVSSHGTNPECAAQQQFKFSAVLHRVSHGMFPCTSQVRCCARWRLRVLVGHAPC